MNATERNSNPVWDCHCHLSFLENEDSENLISSNPNVQWILGGYQPSEWEHQVHLKKRAPNNISTCYGLHPWYVKSDEFDLSRDLEALKIWGDQAQWIGEVGLDFFGDDAHLKKDLQINVFEQQLEMSSGQPFVFHVVQAHRKALEILNGYSVKGFVHSFSGSPEIADSYYNEGILLSFGPSILNDNFKKARESLVHLPIEAILVESDTPSHPLDEESPIANLELVYSEVARLKKISVDDLKIQVAINIENLRNP